MICGQIVDCLQGDPLWLETRRGKVTASRINDVLAKRRDKQESEIRRKYKMELVAERLSNLCVEHYVSGPMEWGIETEPLARTAYEFHAGVIVESVGIVLHPSIEHAAASPDGFVGDEGQIECKCPNTLTHLDYILAGEIPPDYQNQMLWQMACTGREWTDFISYDPRLLDDDLQLFVRRFKRDETRIGQIELEVRQFLKEVEQIADEIRSKQLVTA